MSWMCLPKVLYKHGSFLFKTYHHDSQKASVATEDDGTRNLDVSKILGGIAMLVI